MSFHGVNLNYFHHRHRFYFHNVVFSIRSLNRECSSFVFAFFEKCIFFQKKHFFHMQIEDLSAGFVFFFLKISLFCNIQFNLLILRLRITGCVSESVLSQSVDQWIIQIIYQAEVTKRYVLQPTCFKFSVLEKFITFLCKCGFRAHCIIMRHHSENQPSSCVPRFIVLISYLPR